MRNNIVEVVQFSSEVKENIKQLISNATKNGTIDDTEMTKVMVFLLDIKNALKEEFSIVKENTFIVLYEKEEEELSVLLTNNKRENVFGYSIREFSNGEKALFY